MEGPLVGVHAAISPEGHMLEELGVWVGSALSQMEPG